MSESNTLSPDLKIQASTIFGDVLKHTADNFPIARYRPQFKSITGFYKPGVLDTSPYGTWPTADGIGTKPELAERLYDQNRNPEVFGTLPFDLYAMIDGDAARSGMQLLGIVQEFQFNKVNLDVVNVLAQGCKKACEAGRFALLNGETAQLGKKVGGYGETRINMGAVGTCLVIPEKMITGESLKPGQPIVAFRESSIRSNGLTLAKQIMENVYLQSHEIVTEPIPWHLDFPELTKELLRPSLLYGKVINEAQGWGDQAKKIEITGAAHITEGGVPGKLKRLLEPWGLGAHLTHYEGIFPDPRGIQELLKLAATLPSGEQLISDRLACETWNRGIGFIAVTKTFRDANLLRVTANSMGYHTATIGIITNDPVIEWRGHTWEY